MRYNGTPVSTNRFIFYIGVHIRPVEVITGYLDSSLGPRWPTNAVSRVVTLLTAVLCPVIKGQLGPDPHTLQSRFYSCNVFKVAILFLFMA